ncbi:MAG TPA: ABC transporter ATP-binding protein [Longimicrobiales bacterium]|nr:ABC transporter ATP-binding protein [Longimicrobiales bacterium]
MDHNEEDALGKAYDARLMRRLLQYLRPYRKRVTIAIAVLLFAACVEAVGPLLTRAALDNALTQRNTSLLLELSLFYLGTMIIAFVLEAVQTVLTVRLGQSVMFDLRRQLFSHLQRLRLPFFDRNPVGRLITRVTSDVEVLNELFSSGVVTVFGDVFTLLVFAGVMLYVDWQLALATFAVLPLVIGFAGLFRSRIRDAFRDIRVRLARINAYLQERISGVAVIQLFGRERDTSERFREITGDHLQAHLRSVTYYALFFPVIEVMTSISLAAVLYYGGMHRVSFGTLAMFIQYARRFYRPIQDLSEKYNMLQEAMASSERVFRLLDEPVSERPTARPPDRPSTIKGRIEFKDVWFAYLEHEGAWDWVLRGVSFVAEPGERIAIVGHTGAGKTTIIGLLMRFYEPQRGQILLDGVDIREIPERELRAHFGLVLQDVFIFSESVEYNIRLGRTDIPQERVRFAAERVGAAAFIEQLPQKYETALGERGLSLSVGERQLLSFARALAYDPGVLILDEATSSVDSALEERIDQAVETLMRGRTSLVIAHRLSTVHNANRILVLHHGELAEAGTHEELIRLGGLYSRLYELQFVRPDFSDQAHPVA